MNWQKSGKDGGTGDGTAVTYRVSPLFDLALLMANQTTRYFDSVPWCGTPFGILRLHPDDRPLPTPSHVHVSRVVLDSWVRPDAGAFLSTSPEPLESTIPLYVLVHRQFQRPGFICQPMVPT
jgi:hypothetical protein